MKDNITNEIKEIFIQSRNWLELQVEYTKLTAAEKATLLTATSAVGAICMMLGQIAVFLLSFALVDLFKMMMVPALAYLATAGIILICTYLIFVFRRPLIFNPIARYMTRLLLSAGSNAQTQPTDSNANETKAK